MECEIVLEKAEEGRLRFTAFNEKNGYLGFLQTRMALHNGYILEGINVKDEYRRNGVANALLDFFLKNADELGATYCNMFFNVEDYGTEFLAFMEQRKDFCVVKTGLLYKASLKGILMNPTVHGYLLKQRQTTSIIKLKDASMGMLSDALEGIRKAKVGYYENENDLRLNFNGSFSFLSVRGDRATGGIFITTPQNGSATVQILYFEDSNSVAMSAMELILTAIKAGLAYDSELKLEIFAINEQIADILDRLTMRDLACTKAEEYSASWLKLG